MAIIQDETIVASDFINESEKDATPANDNGRVVKLEDDARVSNSFLKKYKVNTTTSYSSEIALDFNLFEQYEATAQDDAVSFATPLNMEIGKEMTVSLRMVNDETYSDTDNFFYTGTAPTTLEQDYVYLFTIKRVSAGGYSISWVRYFYINKSIEFVGSDSENGSKTIDLTSLTGGIDTAPEENDIVIILASSGDNAQTISMVTAGYTQLDIQRNSNDTLDTASAVFYKVMGATPDTDAEVTIIGKYSIIAYVLRGIDTSTPIDVTTVGAVGSNSNLVDSPSITPVTNGAWVISMGAGSNDGSTATTATGIPTGYTNDLFQNSALAGGTVAVSASRRWISTDGAENPSNWTMSLGGSTESWSAFTIALRPQAE